jgi:hypothetical protein
MINSNDHQAARTALASWVNAVSNGVGTRRNQHAGCPIALKKTDKVPGLTW